MRRVFRIMRQIGIAGACALAVAVVASRVNRVTPADHAVVWELGLEEVLPDVRIDGRSVRGAIESIRRVTKTPVRIDADLMMAPDHDEKKGRRPLPLVRLRNVPLRAALSVALDEFPQSDGLCFWEENGVVRIGRHSVTGESLCSRVYDVRDIFQIYRRTERVAEKDEQIGLPREQMLGRQIEQFLGGVAFPNTAGGKMRVWEGWLFVYDVPEKQQRVKDLLLLLRAFQGGEQRGITP